MGILCHWHYAIMHIISSTTPFMAKMELSVAENERMEK
jgi:hypothetical protein